MKLVVDIDENEIQESVVELIVKNTISDMESMLFDDSKYSHLRKMYKDTVQQLMRDIIKKHEAEIIDKAIEQAAAIIARKAWTIKAGEIK